MFATLRTYYLAALLVIPFSVDLFSTVRWMHANERESAIQNAGEFLLFLQLDAQISNTDYEDIIASIESMEGIDLAQLEQPAPAWSGDPALENQWNALWKTYLYPVISVMVNPQSATLEQIPSIVERLETLMGVEKTLWDEGRHAALLDAIESQRQKQRYITGFYLVGLLMVLGGLVHSFPIFLRRKYIVMTGMHGAGSQIDPEKVLLKIILRHIKAALLVHTALAMAAYSLLPVEYAFASVFDMALQWLESALVIIGFMAALFLMGWWLSASQEISKITMTRPPHIGHES